MTLAATTYRQLLDAAKSSVDAIDAELLLLHVIDKNHAWLFSHFEDIAPAALIDSYRVLIERRQRGEPVAYLTGRRGFWTLNLQTSPATLIPRAETELLVELALARISAKSFADVLDLGTGTGAIALAIAKERPQLRIAAVDISDAALAVARTNASEHAIENVSFVCSDWFSALDQQQYDLIVSNPPYIESNDPHLLRGDLRFEPQQALASGIDGLDAIRRITAIAPNHLRDGGWLLIEHGWQQGQAVQELLEQAGFASIQTAHDLEQRPRVTLGKYR